MDENKKTVMENMILRTINQRGCLDIYWFANATHKIWRYVKYRKVILDSIKLCVDTLMH